MSAARSAAKTFGVSLGLLRTKRFGTFWFASLLSNIGTWAQQVAQPWLLLSLGASSFLVGLDAFAMDAPVWGLTLVGGMLADRNDRRRIIFWCQSVQMLCPTLLVVLLLTHRVTPWAIIACSLVVGVTDALSMPSFGSIVPSIVEKDQIGTGIALNSAQFNLSRILGPSLAGVLMSSVGAVACFGASAISYVPFILVAWLVLPRRSRANTATPELPRPKLTAGLSTVLKDRRLRGALLTVLTTGTLCGPLITFCPVLVRDEFHGDATLFSVALMAFGVGGLLGATSLLAIEGRYERRKLSSRFAVGYAVVVLLAGLNPWLWALPVLMVLAGIAMSISNTQANSLLQSEAGAWRGQAASLFMLCMRGGMSLGSLVTGLSASGFGVRTALMINGALAVGLHLLVGRAWARNAAAPAPAAV